MNRNTSTKSKPEVVAVEFRPLKEGGVMSTTRTETKRGGQGGGPSMDYESEDRAHSTMEDAHAHLTKCLGHCMPEGKADEADRDTKADKG